jgi:hypothetical protein
MPPWRQTVKAVIVADVVLFLIAAAFNDHSRTSVDGIIWWTAIVLFVLLLVAGSAGLLVHLRGRVKRPGRRPARQR